MRYVIIGAGAVGGAIGGRLAEAGHDVVLVARGAHHEALRAFGLRLMTAEGTRTHLLPVVDEPAALGALRADDVLLLAVKTQDSEAALAAWGAAPVVGGGTAAERLPLVCAQNGVESQRLALRRFRRVYGVCVWLPATFVEPGAVSAAGTPSPASCTSAGIRTARTRRPAGSPPTWRSPVSRRRWCRTWRAGNTQSCSATSRTRWRRSAAR